MVCVVFDVFVGVVLSVGLIIGISLSGVILICEIVFENIFVFCCESYVGSYKDYFVI